MEATSQTRFNETFSPLEYHQDIAVIKTPVNLAQPLHDAVMRLVDSTGSINEDDAEGCPISFHVHSLSDPTQVLDPGPPSEDPSSPHSTAPAAQHNAPSNQSEHLSNKDARDKAYRRRKKQQKRHRERSKLEHSFPSPKYKISPGLSAKLSKVVNLQVPNNTADLHAAKGAWIGVRGQVGQEHNTLDALLAQGYTLKKWDGITPFVITDEQDRIFAIFAGRPQDPSFEKDRVLADSIIESTGVQLQFSNGCQVLPRPTNGCAKNRRGKFKTANVGVSYGGGQRRPGNLCHTEHNKQVLRTFFQHSSIRRIANFANYAFAFFAPKWHEYYRLNLKQLWEHSEHLEHNISGSIFPAASINFGPEAISFDHLDHNNLAGGMCSITAGGSFDPTEGGHIYLVELKLVIEFPPGSTILIPSAVIRHGNVPIRQGETRTSFTQYAAGGLFRWVDYGFKTWNQLSESDPARANRELQKRTNKWAEFLNLFSKVHELESDHLLVRNRSPPVV